MQRPRLPSSFRERRLVTLVTALSVSTFGTEMATVALAFAILDLGGPRDLGLVLLAREVPLIVLLMLGGVWADRVPRAWILVGSDLARGTAQAAAAALVLSGRADVWSLALLQVVVGGAVAFARPAHTGFIQQVARPEQLQEANAILGLSRSVLQIAGPAAGAAVVALADPGWALAADAATFFISAVLVASMRVRGVARAARLSVLRDLVDGWREFTMRTWVWVMVAAFGLYQLTLFPALLVLGPYVAKTELGGAGAWGAILSAHAAGGLVGGLLALRLRFARPLVAVSLLAAPAGVALIALGAGLPVPVIAAVGFVSMGCLALSAPIWFATLQEKIPEHAISRISSFDWLGSVALNPIGYALIGPLAAEVGVATALFVSGALNILVSLSLLLVPAIRELRGDVEAEVEDAFAATVTR